jgi:hypothetical protein
VLASPGPLLGGPREGKGPGGTSEGPPPAGPISPLLNAIYEEDFLGFSYGFRPKRGQHNALDALVVGITSRRVNFIFDADVASFFDSVSKDWLVRFVEHRIRRSRFAGREKAVRCRASMKPGWAIMLEV